MASQSNVSLNTRSMNGIITLSDGAGTTISNGVITTNIVNAPFLCETNQPETISGLYNFTTLPTSSLIATNSNQFLTLGAFTPLDINNVKLTGNQTISGIKTFTTLPQASLVPALNAEFANKFYVDNQNINNMNLVTNQTVVSGIKTFNILPQSSAVPTVNSDLTNKLYVDSQIGSGFVTLTTNQTITGIKTFDNGLVITDNQLIKLEATGTNNISASSGIVTYNAQTSHNFGTLTSLTTMSDGVYCKKLAVGLLGKAQTYLNYANIANIITASITLTSTFGSFLDSLYFVNLPATLTPVIVTLPSVNNDNLGTVLCFYKNTSALAEFQLLALSGQQMFSSKLTGGSTQSLNFKNSTTFIKIVAVKTATIFGWYVMIGLENTDSFFNSITVADSAYVESGRIYFGPTPIASVYYNDIFGLGVPSLALNCDNLGTNPGGIFFKIQNVDCGFVKSTGVHAAPGLAFILGAASIGSIQMSGDGERLQISKGAAGTTRGIDFLVNATNTASITESALTMNNKPIVLTNFAGLSASLTATSTDFLISSSVNAGASRIAFTANGINAANITSAGLFMVSNKPVFLSANSTIFSTATQLFLQSNNGATSQTVIQNNGFNSIILNNTALYLLSGYAGKQGVNATTFGSRFNIFWNGSFPELWIDTTFVGGISLFSDYRLKENICCENKPVLERLCRLQLFEYDMKTVSIFKPSGRHYGFFAHEAQDLFPELDNIVTGNKDKVNNDGDLHPQTINLEITTLYLRAIQELNDIVKKQQAQIDVLNARLGII